MSSLDEEELVYYVTLPFCVLSIIGSLFIVTIYLLLKEIRVFTFRLIFYLALMDLLFASSFAIPWFINDYYCYVQALLMNFAGLSVILWTATIAYTLNKSVVHEKENLESYEPYYYFIAFGIPALLEGLPFITGSYGKAQGWCWISLGDDNHIKQYTQSWFYGQMWRLLCYYLPLWLTMGYNSWVYYRISKKIVIVLDNSKQEEKMKRMLLIRLKLYPIILVICQTPVSMLRIAYFIGMEDDGMLWLSAIAGIFVILNGILNALVYGLTDTVKNALRRYREKYSTNFFESSSLIEGTI
ncbi:unnamed protein product [Blepharisma stoltei]|uniref:G-protein coupled receptors family 2 profile 2 domain-containing protein n=1 Tax=Blepharisma stoltei TaxID=1481888 RepID=A0AAU9JUX2_9CILI|nr:unnamed protein product [Blepharisma stoltei]